MSETLVAIDFAGRRRPIRVRIDPEVVQRLPQFLAAWPSEPSATDGPVDIRLEPAGGAYVLEAAARAGAPDRFDQALDAANGLVGSLIEAWVRQGRDGACLHAGAAEVGGGLVAFLGDSGSGKSSLSLHLAAAGHRFFGDDRLGLQQPDGRAEGVSLGLAAKLRLPLPADAGARFAAFVAARTERESDGLAYLRLAPAEAAVFGESCPLAAVVLPARQPGARARLERLPRAAAVRALLAHGFAPQLGPAALVEAFAALAERVPAYRLRFARSRAAVELVAAQLSGAGE